MFASVERSKKLKSVLQAIIIGMCGALKTTLITLTMSLNAILCITPVDSAGTHILPDYLDYSGAETVFSLPSYEGNVGRRKLLLGESNSELIYERVASFREVCNYPLR